MVSRATGSMAGDGNKRHDRAVPRDAGRDGDVPTIEVGCQAVDVRLRFAEQLLPLRHNHVMR